MKVQSMLAMLLISVMSLVFGDNNVSMITNQTSYAVDVYDFTKLDSICFAGARPVVGPDILLSYATKPRVQEGCFVAAHPIMSSILPGSSQQVPANQRLVLKCSGPFYFTKCLHCHNFWFGHRSAMFAYQMIETKPGMHYIVKAPDTHHFRKQ